MVANLYGDFVKGKDYTFLPTIVQRGVKLHRRIDDFIDHHPLIIELKSELYKPLPKISGIAIDLYMDHLLAKNWEKYSTHALDSFVNDFFQFALNKDNQTIYSLSSKFTYPSEFINLLKLIHEQQWIIRYKKIDGLIMASSGLSKRISFNNSLHKAPDVFIELEQEITNVFHNFMNAAKNEFNHIN
jgi:acyl carrier protein phosphodiesterase